MRFVGIDQIHQLSGNLIASEQGQVLNAAARAVEANRQMGHEIGWRVPALSYFLVAYVLVTVLAAGLTIAYGAINNSPQPQELGVGLLKAPAFVATVPYHVVIMLLVWPIFAWLYFRKRRVADRQQELKLTFLLACLWLLAAIVVDFFGFVLSKNPWSLTPHEFYVDYQPWITLIYISIFMSPWIRFWLSRLHIAPAR